MDELDQRILAALAADSSTSTSRLARRFKVARSTVQARIERMERTGVIGGYTVKLGDDVSVRRIRATVLLEIAAKATAAILQRLRAMPEVEIAHTTTGRWDLIVQVAAATTQDLDEVLDRIEEIEDVGAFESMIHLSTRIDRAM
ncbi:DNA-binding transcriptional regulator, Lrp family [Tranquillimonas rosea]|uniref:DNA-binding transcriptional regulator, Lrp family n=1 Tax=Tranquillimonas rosea TaxID=641238 RepID=A0A1H9WXH7_9RHOB|nr:Lrp/AsnC family transcriptional regulator [Tranquillimonas rosea]SES38638.1 DNA-binding transcriptional regulator, Lrp family [Tranquillimonas rosea]